VEDTRLVFHGIRYLLEAFIARQWSQRDVDRAATFFRYVKAVPSSMLLGFLALTAKNGPCCSTHMAPGFTDFPFPKDLMVKFVQQNNGKEQQCNIIITQLLSGG